MQSIAPKKDPVSTKDPIAPSTSTKPLLGREKAAADILNVTKAAAHVTAPKSGTNTEEEIDYMSKIIYPGGGIIPRFPDPDRDFHAVRLPSPPAIPETATDLDAAWLLVKAYRGAVEQILKQPCHVFRAYKGETLQRSQYYKLLVEGARAMRDFEIPPGSWVMFSFDAWKSVAKGAAAKQPPPITFVFGAKRIAERHGWFSRVETGYRNMRRLFTQDHREVITRHSACRQLGLRILERVGREYDGYIPPNVLRARIEAMVESEFPGGYQLWLDKAKASGDTQHATLNECLANGEFVWG
jgi:hypothetical protein